MLNIIKQIRPFVIFFTLLFATFTMSAFAGEFTITGSIKGLPEGAKLLLVPSATHQNDAPIAFATCHNEKFEFRGKVDGPRLLDIKLENHLGVYSILLESGTINVTGEITITPAENDKICKFQNMVVTGSPLNDELHLKLAPRAALDSIYTSNMTRHKEMLDKYYAASAKNDTTLTKSIQNSPEYKEFNEAQDKFIKNVESTYNKLIADNKNSWWGPLIALEVYNFFTRENKPIYEQLSAEAKNSYYGKLLKEQVEPEGLAGQISPELDVKSSKPNQKKISRDQILKGHKYTVIDFWASWCVPCRKVIPAMKAAYAELKAKGVQVISISIDQKENDWLKAEKEEKLPWLSFLDKGKTSTDWKVQAIPSMFLLDENGKVILDNVTFNDIKAKIKTLN